MTAGRAFVTLGETMGLFRPDAIGRGELVENYRLGSGGAESNVAIGIARLGGTARWIGRVGADVIGRKVIRDLRAEGVQTREIVDPDAATGVMTKERRVSGRSWVHYARSGSAGSRLAPSDIRDSDLADVALLHVTGITPALSDSASAAVDAAVTRARAVGADVSFDVNHRPSLWRGRDPRESYRRLAAQADIVFAGEDEAAMFTEPGTPAELATGVARLGPRTVVIKLGERGALVLHDGDLFESPAVPVTVVDTVGAGDAFVAGYLTERLTGASPRDCLHLAVRTGAFACMVPGDWEGFPRRDELALLDSSEPVTR